jgi:hypothetical protein
MVSTRRNRQPSPSPERSDSSSTTAMSSPLTPDVVLSKHVATPSKASRKVKKEGPKSFMDLPRELRDQIYREMLAHAGPVKIQQPKFHLAVRSVPSLSVAILRTTKQIYEEALRIMFSDNHFVLDLNMITAIDWLASLPTIKISGFVNEIGLSKAIMTGYLRLELGLFDSTRLRQDFIKKLVYDLNIKTINIEVPDQYKPSPSAATAAGIPGGNPLAAFSFRSRHDYSWSLTRELLDVLLEGGFKTLRLNYESPHPSTEPQDLVKLHALARLLYLDDEFEVESSIKRIEMARVAGRREEFKDKAEVEKHVRSKRNMRDFTVKYDSLRRGWEKGNAVVVRMSGEDDAKGGKDADGFMEMRKLVREAAGDLPREGWFE